MTLRRCNAHALKDLQSAICFVQVTDLDNGYLCGHGFANCCRFHCNMTRESSQLQCAMDLMKQFTKGKVGLTFGALAGLCTVHVSDA